MSMVRVFVGSFTTKRIQEQVELIKEKAERHIKGKWVEPQNYHITYQFIGEVEESKLLDIVKALQEVVQKQKPVKVKYRSLGVFPDVERARVLWIGVAEGHNQLKNLARDVINATRRVGIKTDGKPFYPHVTVCRIKEYDKRWLKNFLRQHQNTFFGEDTIESIALVKSSLTSVGPIYTVLEEFYFHG